MIRTASYSRDAIRDWFHRTLGIDAEPNRNEIKTKCPECGRDRFYFNISKLVGICHSASCGITPSLEALIDRIGFGPSESGYWEQENAPVEAERPAKLPGWPVAMMMNGKLMTTDEGALDYLRKRAIDDHTIVTWGITSDGERVYVPITHNDVLVNYNSRALPGVPGRKYLYYPGAKTSHFILGYNECKLWDNLTLVENTFVSLAYRKFINCSTTFGSSISETQADMIADSKIKEVAILWDENAEKNAERSMFKLHARGIPAAYWSIKGQPDDYDIDWVIERASRVLEAARNGVPCVDLKEECDEELAKPIFRARLGS